MKNIDGRKIHVPVLNPTIDFESWHFNIKLQSGEFIKIYFSINDNFNIPVMAGLSFQLIKNNKNEIVEKYSIESKEASFHEEKCEVRIGENWCINHGDYYEVFVKINGNGAHLKLYPLYPSWSPADEGMIKKNIVGTKYFGWTFPVIHSKVEGILYQNEEIIEACGTGLLDHCWGNDSFHNDLKYLQIGNFFFDNNVWIYYMAMENGGAINASLVGVSKNGVKWNLLKHFDQGDLKVRLSDFTDRYDVSSEFAQKISFKEEAEGISLNINVREQISVNENVNSRIKANRNADFITDVELILQEGKLRQKYNTVSIGEYYSFVE